MRNLVLCLTALLVAVPASAQRMEADPDHKVTDGGNFPAGWHARVDRDQPASSVVFKAMGDGYHATMGPAAVFYNPAWSKSGSYDVAARFTQTTSPRHPEAYGIVLGGADLDGADQRYSYFLVRKDGKYFIATRRGADRTKVVDWTEHAAIQKEDASGKQVNVLGARVEGDQVVFTVNGTEVSRQPKSAILTDGVFGYRVNHNLDVHIDPMDG